MISGHFTVKQEGKTVIDCDNHLTMAGAQMILATLVSGATSSVYYPGYQRTFSLGDGAVTPSFDATVQNLVGTIPTTQTSQFIVNGTIDFDVKMIGTIAGNTYGSNPITEIGINAYAPVPTGYAWTSHTSTLQLIGYISAPTDFAIDAIDPTKSLTIEWKLRFSFV